MQCQLEPTLSQFDPTFGPDIRFLCIVTQRGKIIEKGATMTMQNEEVSQPKRLKKPVAARLDEVIIAKDGDTAVIDYLDTTIGGVNLKIGPQIASMSDQEILDLHNEVLAAQQRTAAAYKHVAVEIPEGLPQVRYFEEGDQWVPRGNVLRCLIHDDDRQPIIEIDGRDFALEEFGTMLNTYAGWGMRIVFVPDDELNKIPDIVVRDGED